MFKLFRVCFILFQMEGKIDASEFIHLEDDCFHVVDSHTLSPNDLDTGDIILFSRRCADMNLFGAILCYAAKVKVPCRA